MLTAIAVLVVLAILVCSEYLARYKGVHSELTRKFVHILVGIFVAFWPFFLSWGQIQFLSLAFLVVVGLSIKFHVFRSIHAVERNTMGELLFALVIGVLAFIVTNKWVFAASMLHLSLADGLAAVVGLGWGDHNKYKILGHTKSIAGSLAFFFTSIFIMIWYVHFSHASADAFNILVLPVIATITENLAIRGTDNMAIPLLVGLALTSSL
jgi:dolichol kinase